MKFSRWFNCSAAWLVLLLQRTPVISGFFSSAEFSTPPRAVSLLQSAVATAAALGAVHTLAGATKFVVSNSNVIGTVGTPIAPVGFTVTGAQSAAGSYSISGTVPPGLSVTGMNSSRIVNTSTGSITGTPTTSGVYTVSILAWENTNAKGTSFGPTTIRFTIADGAAVVPSLTSPPTGQSVVVGASATFAVTATGTAPLTYQWFKDGGAISGATSPTLTLTNVQATTAGIYSVMVSNSAGNVTSTPAPLTVATTVSPPLLTVQPASQYATSGATVVLAVAATGTGLGYQWSKDGVAITGAVGPTLTLAQASAATMGFYSVTVTNSVGTATSSFATVTISTGGASRLINVATRGYVSAGSALTPGFVLQGTGTKPLVIRAIGPTLNAFGLGGALADPMLEVIPLGSSTAIATNDNWGGSTTLSTAFSNVGAFPLDQPASKDASVVGSFSSAGATGYSARITSAAIGGAGLALAEIYDDGPLNAPVRLVNVSTIGFVGIGEQALIPGFVIGGNAPKQVLIRAVGPGLQPFGVPDLLANPQLSVVPLGKDFSIATNDNWGGTAELQAAFNQASAFALSPGSTDAAVLLRLPPGGYSVVVSGVGNTTGTALVEVYDLDP